MHNELRVARVGVEGAGRVSEWCLTGERGARWSWLGGGLTALGELERSLHVVGQGQKPGMAVVAGEAPVADR